MLSNKKISIVLGLMCFALVTGICVQIKTVKESNITVSGNYEENNLRSQVLKYKERYDNKQKEFEKAKIELEKERQDSTQNNAELQEKENAIKEGNKIIGLTEVKGPGVSIKLTDSKLDASKVLNPNSLVVHDLDVLSVINELRNAGAEAIAINGQRVVNVTGITCRGSIIDVNGEKIGAPFVIDAIGLPEQLANIDRPYGYLARMREDGVGAKLTKSNQITIPKYTGQITYEHAKTVKE